ncbi:hypothetical protein M408DRAFT_327158 [Serendipita vermifera MAFF 305830]|uniref:Thioredoxin domain-containing protein n=1 Tax=Serendipita vermifera MAFF 305830 TaxID=933852 RepID=A0A0C3BJQ6_SERVB|nr:hypothetical protein M408DRAFT_327158 [Serendipita vermifera MAFF 305830]
MAKENPGVKFYKLDVDDVGEAAQAAEVRAMPTFILYRKGEKQANPVRGANPPGIQGLVTFAKTLA